MKFEPAKIISEAVLYRELCRFVYWNADSRADQFRTACAVRTGFLDSRAVYAEFLFVSGDGFVFVPLSLLQEDWPNRSIRYRAFRPRRSRMRFEPLTWRKAFDDMLQQAFVSPGEVAWPVRARIIQRLGWVAFRPGPRQFILVGHRGRGLAVNLDAATVPPYTALRPRSDRCHTGR